jgi:hypothetical protein
MLDVRVVYSPGISDAERRMLALVARLPRAADDLRAPFTAATKHLIAEQFRTEGEAYGGSRWAALARSTRLAKLRAGTIGRGILVHSGRMRALLLGFSARDWAVTNAGGRLAYLLNLRGSPPYGFHHHGTRRMPRRRVLPAQSPGFSSDLRRILADYLLRATGTVTSEDIRHAQATADRLATPELNRFLNATGERGG